MGSANDWSYITGEKGRNRVRAYETSSGIIYLEYYDRDPETGHRQRKRVSTRHRDREKAKRQADKLAAQFAEAEPETDSGLTLRKLFDRYLEKRTPQVSERQQKHHNRCAELFCRYYGWDRKAEELNRENWDDFIQDRGDGSIDARGHSVAEANQGSVGARRVQENLQALRAVFNWAVQADLLDVNPVDSYPLPDGDEPRRPRVSEERYRAMLEVASEVDWRFRVALVLANETGHRSKAIRRLRWSDVNLQDDEPTVRWRGDEDKSGHEHVTPLPPQPFRRCGRLRPSVPESARRGCFPPRRIPQNRSPAISSGTGGTSPRIWLTLTTSTAWAGTVSAGSSPTSCGRFLSRISRISVAGRRSRPSSSATRARISDP